MIHITCQEWSLEWTLSCSSPICWSDLILRKVCCLPETLVGDVTRKLTSLMPPSDNCFHMSVAMKLQKEVQGQLKEPLVKKSCSVFLHPNKNIEQYWKMADASDQLLTGVSWWSVLSFSAGKQGEGLPLYVREGLGCIEFIVVDNTAEILWIRNKERTKQMSFTVWVYCSPGQWHKWII